MLTSLHGLNQVRKEVIEVSRPRTVAPVGRGKSLIASTILFQFPILGSQGSSKCLFQIYTPQDALGDSTVVICITGYEGNEVTI